MLTAAADLVLEGGLATATVEGIAARAEVSKATIYRWWPSRGAVVLDGLLDRVQGSLAVPEGVGVRAALEFQVDALVSLFRDTLAGPLIRALISQAESDPELAQAIRERWVLPRRAVVLDVLRSAAERGELRAGIDLATVSDQLFAPLYYRLLIGHEPLDAGLAQSLVGQVLDGIGASPSA